MTRHRSREGSFAYSLRVLVPPLREARVFSTVNKNNFPSLRHKIPHVFFRRQIHGYKVPSQYTRKFLQMLENV
jgi:hypothetical protein